MDRVIYSPEENIALFSFRRNEQGEKCIVYMNRRNARKELIKLPFLLVYLIEMELKYSRTPGMIYSPREKIPMGIMFCDKETGIYYIEVKHKRKKEIIRLETYFALLLEGKVRKAG